MNDLAAIVPIVERIGIIGVLVTIIWSGIKRVWVFGYQLDDEKAAHQKTRDDRDQWMRMALGVSTIADRAVQHASTLQSTPPLTTKAS